MNRAILTLGAAALLALAACDKPASENTTTPAEPTSKEGPTATATATQANAPTPPPQVTIADDDLSTPADFEEQAEKSITKKTYKADLTALEGEISKEE